MAAHWSVPSGWPIVEAGLLMAAIDEVMLVRVDAKLTDAGYARHLKELARAIDERDAGIKIGVLYDSLGGVDTNAQRRQQAGEVLSSRRVKLAATTAGFTLVTDSAVMRGVLRAVFWLAPPPYPWRITATLREGLDYLRTQMPRLDVERVLSEYERLKAQSSAPGTMRKVS